MALIVEPSRSRGGLVLGVRLRLGHVGSRPQVVGPSRLKSIHNVKLSSVSGTPGGVGVARNPQVFLKDGDVVRIEVDKIGVLENRVKKVEVPS